MKLEEIKTLKELEENWRDVNLEKRFSFREEDIAFSEGETADIYQIDDIYYGRAIKKENSYNEGFSKFCAMKTDVISRDLIQNNVATPKTYGAYLVRNEETGKYVPMVIMEKYEGLTLDKLKREELDRAESLQNKQVDFIIELGYNPIDALWEKNGLYSKEKDRVGVLDFDYWVRWKEE